MITDVTHIVGNEESFGDALNTEIFSIIDDMNGKIIDIKYSAVENENKYSALILWDETNDK